MMLKYLQVTGMTKREYRVDAHFRVPYATTVVAESAEEAEEKAEKTAKKFSDLFNQLLQFGHYKYKDSNAWQDAHCRRRVVLEDYGSKP